MPALWIDVNDIGDPNEPMVQLVSEAASFILFKLSGEKYNGIHTTTEVYSTDAYGSTSYLPTLINGQFHHIPEGSRQDGHRRLRLRNNPVHSVESVSISGQPITDFQLRNNAYIVRTNGLPWIMDPLNEIEVTYTFGTPPPALGRMAATLLANELLLFEQESDQCALPERVTSSISRQGVSYTLLDPQEFLKEGKTGIYHVDLFLSTVNPNRAKKKPKVYSPDKPRGERIN